MGWTAGSVSYEPEKDNQHHDTTMVDEEPHI